MSEDSDQGRKIVSFTTRGEYVPPEVEAVDVEVIKEGPVVDEAAIEMLKMVLQDLESGVVSGVALMTFRNEDEIFSTAIALPHARNLAREGRVAEVSKLAFMWTGGLALLKDDLVGLAVDMGKYDGCTCGECES